MFFNIVLVLTSDTDIYQYKLMPIFVLVELWLIGIAIIQISHNLLTNDVIS